MPTEPACACMCSRFTVTEAVETGVSPARTPSMCMCPAHLHTDTPPVITSCTCMAAHAWQHMHACMHVLPAQPHGCVTYLVSVTWCLVSSVLQAAVVCHEPQQVHGVPVSDQLARADARRQGELLFVGTCLTMHMSFTCPSCICMAGFWL
jgi:hypothetical protein